MKIKILEAIYEIFQFERSRSGVLEVIYKLICKRRPVNQVYLEALNYIIPKLIGVENG